MGNSYDKIFKENIQAIFPSLSKRYLGIEVAKSESLKDKLQVTVEREADFLQKITTAQGEQLIIHLEFQSSDDSNMLERMRLYHALIKQKYTLPMRQFVIYLGPKASHMKTNLAPADVFTGFELLDLRTFDYQGLLNATTPEEVILAILSNFDVKEAPKVLEQIIQRLQKLTDAPATLEKYIYHLVTLARLRNLTQITQQTLQAMAFTYDIQNDAFYQQGIAQGIEQNTRTFVLNMKKSGFSTEDISKATGLTKDQIDQIIEE